MKRYLKIVLGILLIILLSWMSHPSRGQCVDGKCPLPQHSQSQQFDFGRWRASARKPVETDRPLRAWRYERRERHYKSVVRVLGQEGNGHQSLGSGCVIRWGKRVIVITARHVIKGARRVFVRGRFRYRSCKVLGVDDKWDIAILEPEHPEEFDVVQLASFQDKRLQIGDRLESCGYGGREDRLAVNSGILRQYLMPERESAFADWFEISGYARQGDSGGPVFSNGKVVGVLWGRNNKTVQATQFGRLHVILKNILGPEKLVTTINERRVVPVNRAGLFDCKPFRPLRPPTPSPQINVQADPRVGNALVSIDSKLDQVVINTSPDIKRIEEENDDKPNPALLVLVAAGGVVGAFVLYFKNEKGV